MSDDEVREAEISWAPKRSTASAADNGLDEMPSHERPRERLLRQGAQALSDTELVAVLLRTGGRAGTVLDVSRSLLAEAGGLVELVEDPRELLRRPGIGPAKAATLLAAKEFFGRRKRSNLEDRDLLHEPDAVADHLWLRYGRAAQEVLGVLYLDVKNRLVGEREIYRGTLAGTPGDPATILRDALVQNAHSVLLFHTHPSGDPTPSTADLLFTERMRKASKLVGVELSDHIIVGHGGAWVSLRRRGRW